MKSRRSPAIAALVSIYGLFADPATIQQQLDSVSGVLRGGAIDVIRGQLNQLTAQPRGTLGISFLIGLVISLWSANGGIKALFDALNVVYREKEEVEEWRTKDPIESFAKRAIGEGALSEKDLEEVRERAERTVTEAVEFADNSPEPPLDTLYEHLYVVEGAGWYAMDERSPHPHRGEQESDAPASAKELAEAGAAYAGQPSGPRPNPAQQGDAGDGIEAEAGEERQDDEATEGSP